MTTAGYGPDFMDRVQIALKNWKAAGIETVLKLKEFGDLHREHGLREVSKDDVRTSGRVDRR